MAIRLIIVGLRRSGTTIFWESFLQDERLTAYDEPFNPLLTKLPTTDPRYPESYRALLGRDEDAFRSHLRPILRDEELQSDFPPEAARYLAYLAASGEHVVLDTTRCALRIAELARLCPQATLVHLYRSPQAMASSHLLPSGTAGRLEGLKQHWRRRTFWTRRRRYSHRGFEELIDGVGRARLDPLLVEAGIDPARLHRLPGVAKLLAFWHVLFLRAERDGREYFKERFVSESFETFCTDPRAALQRVYGTMKLTMPPLDLTRVHRAKRAYQHDSPGWRRWLDELGVAGPGQSSRT